jgi:type IV pilus assembly protein PilA
VAAGAWGCESTTAASKYVASIATTANGVVTVTSQNIGTGANGAVTLIPTASDGTAMTYSGASQTIFKWVCGGTGTTVEAKFLPGSCRGA